MLEKCKNKKGPHAKATIYHDQGYKFEDCDVLDYKNGKFIV